MYEADDLGDANDVALSHSGLGERNASSRVKDKIRKMNMPLEKRFQVEEGGGGEFEKPVLNVTNTGGGKEITYMPKDSRKKQDEQKKQESGPGMERGGRKRQRRSVKELGFKTPFKKH